MRCGCDDCVAIAKKFVNVKFPTNPAGNALGNKKNGKVMSDARRYTHIVNTVNIGK